MDNLFVSFLAIVVGLIGLLFTCYLISDYFSEYSRSRRQRIRQGRRSRARRKRKIEERLARERETNPE